MVPPLLGRTMLRHLYELFDEFHQGLRLGVEREPGWSGPALTAAIHVEVNAAVSAVGSDFGKRDTDQGHAAPGSGHPAFCQALCGGILEELRWVDPEPTPCPRVQPVDCTLERSGASCRI